MWWHFMAGSGVVTERSDWILGWSESSKMSKWAACRKWDVGNDPETLKLAFHQVPTLINAYFQAATNLSDQDPSPAL